MGPRSPGLWEWVWSHPHAWVPNGGGRVREQA